MGDPVKMLSHLSTLEVSNVKRAANRKRYAITKSEDTMSLIKDVLAVPAEGEEQFVATLKSAGADAKRIEAATAAYRIRKGFADVLKPEDLGLTSKAAYGGKETEEEEEEEAAEEEAEMKAKKKSKKASQTGIEPGFTPAKKSEEDPRIEALFKSNQALADQVKQLVTKNQELEFETIAKSEFSHVPGASGELAKVLKAAHAAGPDAEKVILGALKGVNEMVSKSTMLQELGTSGGGSTGSAYQKIEQLAQGLTMKADSGKEMSQAQKIAYVTSKTAEGRALYEQYNEERRQLIKRI